jgi:hypothetical protein
MGKRGRPRKAAEPATAAPGIPSGVALETLALGLIEVCLKGGRDIPFWRVVLAEAARIAAEPTFSERVERDAERIKAERAAAGGEGSTGQEYPPPGPTPTGEELEENRQEWLRESRPDLLEADEAAARAGKPGPLANYLRKRGAGEKLAPLEEFGPGPEMPTAAEEAK